MSLLRKVVVITGCSSGLGFFTAQRMIKAGHIVYASMRNLEYQKKLEQACDNSSYLFIRKLDVANYDELASFVSNILAEQGRIDVLINNAGSLLLGPADSAKIEEVEWLFKVNFFSVLKLTQLIIPHMRENKTGRIINIGSPCGIESSPFLGIYAATKQALEAISINWASTLHTWNIKVSIIQPGAMSNTHLFDSMKIGSYYDDFAKDPYQKFNREALALLQKVSKNGLDPLTVSDLIVSIINDSNPDLCYQPCEYSKILAEAEWTDPTKNKCVQRHRDLVKSWFNED